MKRTVFTIALLMTFLLTFGQKDVYFKINHHLDGNPFAYNQIATTSGSVEYQLSRLEYYIAEITLTHDSGKITRVPKWMLVNAIDTTNEYLGNLNITNLESISFGIGVESFYNHLDPNTYPADHPLAPKFPSMHWGWTAGYRFVALEGKTGTNFSKIFAIHALGDQNYYIQTHQTSGRLENGNLIVELNADYNNALDSIKVSSNLITHGAFGEAATVLLNFNDVVFTQNAVGLYELSHGLKEFSVSPNPTTEQITISIEEGDYSALSYELRDLTGRLVQAKSIGNTSEFSLKINNDGIFMINIYEDGRLIGVEKVIVQ